jgi:4-diphosphocytidyl-2C-methyl-D-erythritol kinase
MGVVIIKPSVGVSTADAYAWLDADRASAAAANPNRPGSPAVEVGWPSGPVPLSNDLMEPVVRRHPVVREMVGACLAQGATGAQMSGSGLVVCSTFPESVASKAARQPNGPIGWCWWPTSHGAKRPGTWAYDRLFRFADGP